MWGINQFGGAFQIVISDEYAHAAERRRVERLNTQDVFIWNQHLDAGAFEE
jgi:hypothetical protein